MEPIITGEESVTPANGENTVAVAKESDTAGFTAACEQGRRLGFDGKTLIPPAQVPVANQVFGPDAQALADARRLIEAATGGAERFEGRMIETMHVEQARALIARAEAVGG